MSKKTSLSIARPFGPFVGKFKLPQALIDDVNSFIDKNDESPEVIKAVDWSSNLVGKVHQELLIPEHIISAHEASLKNEVDDYLQQVMSQGVVTLSTNRWSIVRRSAWVVRSFAGDFNPAHVHSNADICMAGFLRIPDWKEELIEDSSDHAPSRGKLCFMHGNTQEWGNNLLMTEPVVGDCYVFPATLTHFVYPFKSSGERRSFSINFSKVEI